LTNALKDASLQMQFDERVRKDIRNALTYPIFLGAMGRRDPVHLFIRGPRFAAMLKDRILLLPPFSRSIFLFGLFLRDHILLVAAVLMLLIAGLAVLLRRSWFRAWLQEFGVAAADARNLIVEAEAGRWTAMLATLLRNRIPLVHSLALARDALRLESFKARLDQVERAGAGRKRPRRRSRGLQDFRRTSLT